MVDYVGAIRKPFEDVTTLVLGIIIGFVPVVSLLVTGYGVGVGRRTIKGDNKLPAWDAGQFVDYIKDLVFAIIIQAIYSIPGVILLAIGAAAAIGSLISGLSSDSTEALTTALMGGIAAGGIFVLLGLLLLFIGWLFASLGIMFYAKEGSLGAAFKFGAILKKILTAQYLVTLVVLLVYAFVLALVAMVLLIIPVIGAFIGSGLVTFLLGVTGYTMLAQVFKETP